MLSGRLKALFVTAIFIFAGTAVHPFNKGEKVQCEGDIIIVQSAEIAVKWAGEVCNGKPNAQRYVRQGKVRSFGYTSIEGKVISSESKGYYCTINEMTGEPQPVKEFIKIKLNSSTIDGEKVPRQVVVLNNPRSDSGICITERMKKEREEARIAAEKAEKEQFERELADAKNELIPLIQYYNPQRGDNMLATEKYAAELAQYGYQKIRVEACVGPPRKPKNKAENQYWSYDRWNDSLDLFWNGERQDNMTAANSKIYELEKYKYAKIRAQGMTLSSDDRADTEIEGSIPLKLYYHGQRQDNISVATSEGEQSVKSAGYGFINEQGYVWPPSFCN